MAPVSQRSPPVPDTISCHHAVSKRAPNKTFTFWRRKVQAQKPKCVLTPGDRLVQTKKHEQHHCDYLDALEQAHATIQELAEGLRNRFGKHSVEHYYNDLIH